MPVCSDLRISLSASDVVTHLTQGRKREPAPAVLESAAEVAAELPDLLRPALAYELFPVAAVDGGMLRLEGGTRLEIGPRADLLSQAEEVLLAVATIGAQVDQRVRAYFERNEYVRAYLLDTAGVIALGRVEEQVFRLAEGRASGQGWGVGLALSPGSLEGWSVSGQRELTALLPVDRIGVRLSQASMLIPEKSSSLLVGIGAAYTEHAVGPLCHHCVLADSCPWKHGGLPSHGGQSVPRP